MPCAFTRACVAAAASSLRSQHQWGLVATVYSVRLPHVLLPAFIIIHVQAAFDCVHRQYNGGVNAEGRMSLGVCVCVEGSSPQVVCLSQPSTASRVILMFFVTMQR